MLTRWRVNEIFEKQPFVRLADTMIHPKKRNQNKTRLAQLSVSAGRDATLRFEQIALCCQLDGFLVLLCRRRHRRLPMMTMMSLALFITSGISIIVK